jgi:hypothetical protein
MKQTLKGIVGKTIESVVVKTQFAKPRTGGMALYLGFADGTYIEIWTDTNGEIHPVAGVEPGGMDTMLKSGGAATIVVQKCWLDDKTGKLVNEYYSPNT